MQAQHRVDGGGRTLLPGLIDAHGHVIDLGFAALRLDVTGTPRSRTSSSGCATMLPPIPTTKWILGFGWNQEFWTDKRFPTAADLDAVVSDRPVVLERVDGHAVVANSAALKAAGVTAATSGASGRRNPRRRLRRQRARPRGAMRFPSRRRQQQDQALAKSQEILLGYGVTGVGAMSTSVADWQAFRRAGEAGRLQVRLMSYMTGTEAHATPCPSRPTGCTATVCARSESSCSPTARSARAARG